MPVKTFTVIIFQMVSRQKAFFISIRRMEPGYSFQKMNLNKEKENYQICALQ
jgi:hypothetical protein